MLRYYQVQGVPYRIPIGQQENWKGLVGIWFLRFGRILGGAKIHLIQVATGTGIGAREMDKDLDKGPIIKAKALRMCLSGMRLVMV